MRSLKLEEVLRAFVADAAHVLCAAIDDGSEVAYELDTRASRRGQAPLYCYRPLTGRFIRERAPQLVRLPSHAEAQAQLHNFAGLERYLASRDAPRLGAKGRATEALLALLEDVFAEQSTFELVAERLDQALARLERCGADDASEVAVAATLHGLAICTPELRLAPDLTIAHPDALHELPEQARSPSWLTVPPGWLGQSSPAPELPSRHLIAIFHSDEAHEPRAGVARGRRALRELLRALRLFGDGRIALGPLAWARVSDGGWAPIAPGWSGRPHGMLLVGTEQEDELRAFCSLIARRASAHSNELAWALRRFEMGCERPGEHEALSDYVLALRALLEPSGNADGLLAGRVAALCATEDGRAHLAQRVIAALELERAVIDGEAAERSAEVELVRELAGHLRALLRDVLCGHLDGDLVSIADRLLLEVAPDVAGASEELLGDASESGQILDAVI